jgi:pimeloyl-ACP methyl ester carboxylesterase
VKHEIREFVWRHGYGQMFKDLKDTEHLTKKAAELARVIRRLKDDNPERLVYVIAKSGGTGLALAAAQQLPENSLERFVLLSAAVSPQFDLRGALRATHRQIVSFHSSFDQLVLNWGTRQFGTIDRVYGPSAGLHGFREPAGMDDAGRALYSRLVQIPWQPRMLREFHSGGHSGTGLPSFLAAEVAPWVRKAACPTSVSLERLTYGTFRLLRFRNGLFLT